MYRCRECKMTFEYPDYVEICFEDEYGVSSMFSTRNYGVVAQCPYCGHPVYEEEDQIDEEDLDDEE